MVTERAENVARGTSGRWVTLRRACEILGVDESTLRRWADAGRLRVYRTPGGHRRFSLGNLEEMVAGDARHRGSDAVERLATAKVRRELQRARQVEDGWYVHLSGGDREKLRDLGRRLIEIVGEYTDKRSRRSSLLDEALELGGEYGQVLLAAGLPLPVAVGAYIGFRKSMDESTRQMARRESLPTEEALETLGQVHALGDQVLMGMAAAYESTQPAEGLVGETDGR